MTDGTSPLNLFRDFAEAVTDKMSVMTSGEPEDQLRNPFGRPVGERLNRPPYGGLA